MENIKLQIRATAGTIAISTDTSGKFVLPNARSGSYEFQVSPESVPTGYSTEYLAGARQDDPAAAGQLTAHGLAPQNPLESGIFTSLPPGAFTAILAGKNGGTGIGLVEIYNLN